MKITCILAGFFLLLLLLEALFPLRHRTWALVHRLIVNVCMSALAFTAAAWIVRPIGLSLAVWMSAKSFGLLQCIGNSNAILPMTTVASAGAYLLSTPVEVTPNAALHLRRGHRDGPQPPNPIPRRQVQAIVRAAPACREPPTRRPSVWPQAQPSLPCPAHPGAVPGHYQARGRSQYHGRADCHPAMSGPRHRRPPLDHQAGVSRPRL